MRYAQTAPQKHSNSLTVANILCTMYMLKHQWPGRCFVCKSYQTRLCGFCCSWNNLLLSPILHYSFTVPVSHQVSASSSSSLLFFRTACEWPPDLAVISRVASLLAPSASCISSSGVSTPKRQCKLLCLAEVLQGS